LLVQAFVLLIPKYYQLKNFVPCLPLLRCGKVLSVGHARHLEVCKGPPEPPTEEEIAAQVRKQRFSFPHK